MCEWEAVKTSGSDAGRKSIVEEQRSKVKKGDFTSFLRFLFETRFGKKKSLLPSFLHQEVLTGEKSLTQETNVIFHHENNQDG